MNRKVAAIIAAGAAVIGIGAIAANSAAGGATQPVKQGTPSVTTASTTSGATSLQRSASTGTSTVTKVATPKSGAKAVAKPMTTGKSSAIAKRVQQTTIGAKVKAHSARGANSGSGNKTAHINMSKGAVHGKVSRVKG